MVNWTSSYEPLPDTVLQAVELVLGFKLPEPYRTLAQRWPGGHPDRADFKVSRRGSSWGSCVGVLMSLDPRHVDNVFECIKNLSVDDQLPAGLLPIIEDGGGDLVCLDYRQNKVEPRVVYWAHELSGEEGVVDLATDFAAFLTLLEHAPDDDGKTGT